MKKNQLTLTICAVLLMVSGTASAEDQYPASDFKPKVVFSDDSSGTSASSAPAAAPAASASSSSSDADYPAANFQPKVVFEDKDYKHKETISSSSSTAGAASESSSTGSAAATGAAQKDESSAGYLIGLLVLGIAGYVLFKKGAIGLGQGSKAQRATASVSGVTGVARYLLKTSGTGVSRYLEKNAKNAPAAKTGVAKYLASQGPSESTAGRAAATGVEKYMRNKG